MTEQLESTDNFVSLGFIVGAKRLTLLDIFRPLVLLFVAIEILGIWLTPHSLHAPLLALGWHPAGSLYYKQNDIQFEMY